MALRLQLGQILHALEASQAQVFQAALIRPMFDVGCEHPLYLRPLRKPSSYRSFLHFSLESREKLTFLWCPKGHQHQVLSESGSGQTVMLVHPQSLSSVGPHRLPFFPAVGDVGAWIGALFLSRLLGVHVSPSPLSNMTREPMGPPEIVRALSVVC